MIVVNKKLQMVFLDQSTLKQNKIATPTFKLTRYKFQSKIDLGSLP